MSDQTKQTVARIVRDYLKGRRPGDVSLEVVEDGIIQMNGWWRVPVRPNAWPAKRYEYYEELAEIETQMHEDQHLDILISTAEPLEDRYSNEATETAA